MASSDRVELAHEPDFVIGRLTVSPARRELIRDDGEREVLEHRVMQVLIALSKAEGNIVTRDELIMLCWDGRVVGEDSIHRVLSRLRKVARGIGAGSIEIETITKIGYRLTSGDGALRGSAPVAQNGRAAPDRSARKNKRRIGGVAAAVMLAVGVSALAYFGRNTVPLIAVGPADSSPASQLLARDLLVKLGTHPHLGSGRWELVDASSARSTPNLLFRVAANGPEIKPQANLILLDGNSQSLLWSREFGFPAGRDSDLRQHLSLTAARVLDCALEARNDGGLPPDLVRVFLNGCAALAETSVEDPQKTAGIMRAITTQRPRFAAAWAHLLMLDSTALRLANVRGSDKNEARDQLKLDIQNARRNNPKLAEILLAEITLLPPNDYFGALKLLRKAKALAPEKPIIWTVEAEQLSRVGRANAAIASARRATELDRLSPAASSQLVQLLAWSGQTELARKELGRAERLWPETGALRDAQFAFHLRYGDPEVAKALVEAGYPGRWSDLYLRTRLNPSARNVQLLLAAINASKTRRDSATFGYAIQALGEFRAINDALDWLQQYPSSIIAESSYVLFRPALAEVRQDRRFMRVAKRIGLIGYWRTSGNWPDFCLEPKQPYDCKEEARKLTS